MRIEELLHAKMVEQMCANLGAQNEAPEGANQPGPLDQETCIGGVPMSSDGTPTVNPPVDLYRFFDQNDILLYVGISINAAMRSSQHRQDKHWWSDVARMDVEHTKSRDEALQREREAIRLEQPLYNIVHATRAREQVDEACLPIPFDGIDFINRTAPEDHTRFLLFNAYDKTAKAMDELAQLCDRSARENDEPTPGRREFLTLLECMARSLVYGNCCSNCNSWEAMPPIAMKIEGTQAYCVYLCMECRKLDQCWWTLDIALLAGIG